MARVTRSYLDEGDQLGANGNCNRLIVGRPPQRPKAPANLQSGDPEQAAAAGVEARRLEQPAHSDRREIGTLVDHVGAHRQRPAVARFIETATAA